MFLRKLSVMHEKKPDGTPVYASGPTARRNTAPEDVLTNPPAKRGRADRRR